VFLRLQPPPVLPFVKSCFAANLFPPIKTLEYTEKMDILSRFTKKKFHTTIRHCNYKNDEKIFYSFSTQSAQVHLQDFIPRSPFSSPFSHTMADMTCDLTPPGSPLTSAVNALSLSEPASSPASAGWAEGTVSTVPQQRSPFDYERGLTFLASHCEGSSEVRTICIRTCFDSIKYF
jgi:hypothetical protein